MVKQWQESKVTRNKLATRHRNLLNLHDGCWNCYFCWKCNRIVYELRYNQWLKDISYIFAEYIRKNTHGHDLNICDCLGCIRWRISKNHLVEEEQSYYKYSLNYFDQSNTQKEIIIFITLI